MDIKEFIEKFAECIDVSEIGELTPETKFHDLDEWSSLSVMLAIVFFDEEFDKQVSNAEIREAQTIQDLYSLATD